MTVNEILYNNDIISCLLQRSDYAERRLHSRLKSFLFCKSSLPQPFLSLLQDSLYGFPRLFTATSEHIRLFYFLVFFCFYTFLVVGYVR